MSNIKVGDYVEGIMGVDGKSRGTVVKVGSPYSTRGSPSVYVRDSDGRMWDTYAFNCRIITYAFNYYAHVDPTV